MQVASSNPELFSHIRVLISLIVGLGLTRLLAGIARIIQHPRAKPVYGVHLLWVLFVFVTLVQFWWWEFRLVSLVEWNFEYYLFIILYIALYFLACTLLFPDNMDDYSDYREYFLSRRAWFFGLLATIFVLDFGDTLIKGQAYLASLGLEYFARNAAFFALCLVAMRSRNTRYHAAFAWLAIAYDLSWVARHYQTMA